MAIHFLTDELWDSLYKTLMGIDIPGNRKQDVGVEVSTLIYKVVQQNEICQLLYQLACLQVRYLVQGDKPAYEIVTSVHNQVKAVMLQYEQHCHECDAIHETVFDEDYKRWLCKACQMKLSEG